MKHQMFFYSDYQKTPLSPHGIIISFDNYNGPPCFSKKGNEEWAAICCRGTHDTDHYGKQLSLSSVWKFLGQIM